MPLAVHRDPDTIRALLTEAVAAEPVRATILGTLAASLEDGAWCAGDAARLAARSGRHYPLAIHGDWDGDALAELVGLVTAQLPDLRGASGPAPAVEAVVGAAGAGRPVTTMGQALFRLDELVEPPPVPGSAVVAGPEHRPVVREWFVAFMAEADAVEHNATRAADRSLDDGGCWLWLLPDGRPVSLAARRAVVGGSARIGPVYTPPADRGRGFGSAVTAAATRSVLDESAVPVLFTDLANPTSNKIYQAMGYRQVEQRVITLFG